MLHPGPISHGRFFGGDIWSENTFRGGWRARGARHRVYRAPRRGWVPPTPEKIRNPVSVRSRWSNFAKNRFGRFARIPGFPHPEVADAPGPRHRVCRALRGGLGSETRKKIRNPISGGPGWSIFTKNSKVGFDEKSEHFHIRRWLARMENPITDLLGCT